jgi:hypothetical protein
LEASQPLFGEAVAPDEDGADGQPHLVRDRSIGLTVGDAQDDLGAIRGLLGVPCKENVRRRAHKLDREVAKILLPAVGVPPLNREAIPFNPA